jgi:hypothetical protein
MVRKNAIVVRLDGKDFYTWEADWSKVSVNPDQAVQEKNVLFVGVRGSWQYSQMILQYQK